MGGAAMGGAGTGTGEADAADVSASVAPDVIPSASARAQLPMYRFMRAVLPIGMRCCRRTAPEAELRRSFHNGPHERARLPVHLPGCRNG
jgi:hypothetical protein